jgi:hypothetical protein
LPPHQGDDRVLGTPYVGRAKPVFAIDRSGGRFYTRRGEPVAQMVEHLTFNQVVLGSSPSGLTNEINYLRLSIKNVLPKSLIGKHMGSMALSLTDNSAEAADVDGARPRPQRRPATSRL